MPHQFATSLHCCTERGNCSAALGINWVESLDSVTLHCDGNTSTGTTAQPSVQVFVSLVLKP